MPRGQKWDAKADDFIREMLAEGKSNSAITEALLNNKVCICDEGCLFGCFGFVLVDVFVEGMCFAY